MAAKTPRRFSPMEERLQDAAQERAQQHARRIPWPRLLQAQQEFLDWQEVYFWARSVLEAAGIFPDYLAPFLEQRCPGFLIRTAPSVTSRTVPLALWDWIDEHIFGEIRREGWFDAVEFFGVRHPRYRRAQEFWLRCTQEWQTEKPGRYPPFRDWLKAAQPASAVSSERLDSAIEAYLEWEALSYWACTPLELVPDHLPEDVERELRQRCAEFLQSERNARFNQKQTQQTWARLMTWGKERLLAEAQAEGWLEAVTMSASLHPRSWRTRDYWLNWDQNWKPGTPYPSFDEWRRAADSYVEAGS